MSQERTQQLAIWAGQQLNCKVPQLLTVSGDASFRRYFRFEHLGESIIAVDAPPQHENNQAFFHIGKLLSEQKIQVPEFHFWDFDLGFLLLSDLGDQLLLPQLNKDTVKDYYQKAIDIIISMQLTENKKLADLPQYNSSKLREELELFNDWFIQRHLQLEFSSSQQQIIEETFKQLIDSALIQPQKLVHRDFHSRNLMLTENQSIAVIDFQDAVVGASSYDLVSLLKDCYIQWPEADVKQWVEYFYQNATSKQLCDHSFETFFRQFEWMGMQRHIKVLGIFARLNYRDNKSAYLKDLPLTFDYLEKASSRYKEFAAFHQLLIEVIKPAMNKCR